jgi:hypothetical protein
MIQQSEIGGALGFDDETTDEIVDYLSDQYLVERRAFGGMIGISSRRFAGRAKGHIISRSA